MIDMSKTIVPRSDQQNADDFISGPKTITITKVSADTGSAEQPILVNFEGDDGKPFKPCKTCRRVMVFIWGSDGSKYVGRSMTLYRDPSVKWGGLEVGGIRISHMSDMDKPVTMALTNTKQSRKPYTVQPLVMERKSPADLYAAEFAAALKSDDIAKWWKDTAARRDELAMPADRVARMQAAVDAKLKPKTETNE